MIDCHHSYLSPLFTISLVQVTESGRRTGRPFPGFRPNATTVRYRQAARHTHQLSVPKRQRYQQTPRGGATPRSRVIRRYEYTEGALSAQVFDTHSCEVANLLSARLNLSLIPDDKLTHGIPTA